VVRLASCDGDTDNDEDEDADSDAERANRSVQVVKLLYLTPNSVPSASNSIFFLGDQSRGPLRVLFLSSDTGGGHRASAESLAKQFQIEFPGSTYDLLDVWTADGVLPYRTLVKSYQHLSAHPRQWRVLFHASNTRPWELLMDWHSTLMCERRIRRRIASYNPDVVVSVHPAMNNAPMIAVRKISKKAGRHIPFFTVVTDLASGHCTWFQKRVEKIYVASERLHLLAQRRGRTPPENIRMAGLPIRVDFARQAAAMGDRTAPNGLQYQSEVKRGLGLDPSKPMVLLMGGGEGVGSLERITDELYASLVKHGVDATICVVCGRNDKLRTSLAERDWDALLKVKAEEEEAAASQLGGQQKRGRLRRLFSRAGSLRRQSRSREIQESVDKTLQEEETAVHDRQGKVDVVGLGFVTNMADYMVAADVLVSKAGPGTIAEAASLGLPVMLTSFLPGQEAGNVDFVLECGFGDYCDDPLMIGEEVACWLQDPALLQGMSRKAQLAGRPDAALDIVRDIGGITHTWMALNGPSPVDTSTLDL
jgi:1,2-diacylglycerol 3-beta-galactosyltransferase